MIYVLDACALLSYLNNEPGSYIVDNLIKKAIDGEVTIYMSIINLIEVHYMFIRNLGKEKAVFMLKKILASPICVVSAVSEEVFQESSRLKASYKCSVADAIGLATAIELTGHFVTSDHHELEAVEEKEPIPFLWLPAHPKK